MKSILERIEAIAQVNDVSSAKPNDIRVLAHLSAARVKSILRKDRENLTREDISIMLLDGRSPYYLPDALKYIAEFRDEWSQTALEVIGYLSTHPSFSSTPQGEAATEILIDWYFEYLKEYRCMRVVPDLGLRFVVAEGATERDRLLEGFYDSRISFQDTDSYHQILSRWVPSVECPQHSAHLLDLFYQMGKSIFRRSVYLDGRLRSYREDKQIVAMHWEIASHTICESCCHEYASAIEKITKS